MVSMVAPAVGGVLPFLAWFFEVDQALREQSFNGEI